MSEENKEAKPEATPTGSDSKKSNKTLYVVLGVIGGILLLIICCCAGLSMLTSSPDFRDGYCEGFLSEPGVTVEDEPFGWCEDYVMNDPVDLEDFEFDF